MTDEKKLDLSSLRLTQNFGEIVGVRKLIRTVPIRKPNRQEFFRVHPSEEFRLETAIIELKEERESYIVAPDLWPEIFSEITPKILYAYINRQGVLGLWPIRLPDESGRLDSWNMSALDAADLAKSGWIRIAANMSLGAYEIFRANADIPDPEWPDLSFEEIVNTAFANRYIDRCDHPVLQRLRGES